MGEGERSRLRWLCRRGMRELDVLLAGFLDHGYADAPGSAQAAFSRLRELQDPEIYALLTARTDTEDPALADVVARIRRAAGL